ncbi:MAG TPA: dockerin type I repeat-containing protein, partial [Gemmatimonadales bacterium]|nr:dockerin type I repeat-containing protein [Gemmatimonadales bacterium]
MRRTVALLLAAAALLAPKPARAQAISAGLGGNASGIVGQPVDIPVIVDMTGRPDRLGAFALTIRWKPSVLQFQQGLGGSFGAVTSNTDSAAQGVIRLTGANPAGVGGLVTLGIGRFVPLSADTTTLALSFSQLYAAGSFADLRPSLTVTSGEYCAAVGRYGDINGDGVINSADALIALTNAVGLPVGSYPIALGDVDSSGVTDTRDALIMLSDAVGIDVSAFPRVDRMLGGACATSAPVTMAITPTSVNGVLVGQEVTFEARATGPTGALVAIPTAVYRSSNSAILAFNDDSGPSSGTALAPGTVTVTAVRDAKDSAQTTVTVVARRTTHWVDAAAAAAPNQLGTQGLPFATIAAALAVAQAGDTVRPQPGRYGESVVADSAVVLLGDTLPDGTRPVLAGQTIGIVLAGQGSSELQNLELDGYAAAVTIAGPSQVLLRGLRTAGVGFGVLTGAGALTRLQIESSRLVGAGPSTAGDGVNLGSTEVDSLIVSGTEISDFGTDGVYGNEVLYVAVHG